MPPVIGITTSQEEGDQRVDHRYVTAVERAGGVPVLLPMTVSDRTLSSLLDQIDGLVVPGGPAVTEGLVGRLPEELNQPSTLRRESDRRWIEHCSATGRPILGICYGMQRLNALAGGQIYGDVEAELDPAETHSQKRGGTTHPIHLEESSRLRKVLGCKTATVNTRHLQAIADLGEGFTVAARAPDGVIEAIEHESGRFFGVQFHPERLDANGRPLFRALIEEAGNRASA